MIRYGRLLAWMCLAVAFAGLYRWVRPVPVTFEPFSSALPYSLSPLGLATDGTSLFVSGTTRNLNSARVLRMGGDGADVRTVLDTGLRAPLGLAVEGDALYVIDCQSGPITDTQIFRGPKDGSAPLAPIYTGSQVGEPIVDGSGIVFVNGALYTTDMVQGRVHRLNPDGTGLAELGHIFPLRAPNDRFWGSHRTTIAADRGLLYIADAGDARVDVPPHVRTMHTLGGPFKTLWTGPPLAAPASITVHNGTVYIADPGAHTVWKMPLHGGRPEVFAAGHPINSDCGIVSLNGNLYLADAPAYGAPGAIYRAPLESRGFSYLPLIMAVVGIPWGVMAGLKRSATFRRLIRRLLQRSCR